MTDTRDRQGQCLCGQVTFRAPASSMQVLQCHCENCRRTSGNFVAAIRTPSDTLEVDDPGDQVRWHGLGYAQYAFCAVCGSTLFYRAADRPHVTSVMVGALNDASDLAIHGVWFAEEAQPHNTLPSGVPHTVGNG